MDDFKVLNKWPKGLIPKANAMICWRSEFPSYRINSKDLRVIFIPFKDLFTEEYYFEEWKEKEQARIRDLPHTWGACAANWFEMSTEDIICDLYNILIDDIKDPEKITDAIFELGKIKEFQFFRHQFWLRKLRGIIPLETLELSYYGYDYCEYPAY